MKNEPNAFLAAAAWRRERYSKNTDEAGCPQINTDEHRWAEPIGGKVPRLDLCPSVDDFLRLQLCKTNPPRREGPMTKRQWPINVQIPNPKQVQGVINHCH